MTEEKKDEPVRLTVHALEVELRKRANTSERTMTSWKQFDDVIDWGANTPAGVLWILFFDGHQEVFNNSEWLYVSSIPRICTINEEGKLVDV